MKTIIYNNEVFKLVPQSKENMGVCYDCYPQEFNMPFDLCGNVFKCTKNHIWKCYGKYHLKIKVL